MSDGSITGAWREALDCVDTLLSQAEIDRGRYLSELALSRPELHARVQSLLHADRQAADIGFLNAPAAIEPKSYGLRAGATLGPYCIQHELGRGGMGEVWLARRDDGLYQGEVAIKTLHPYFAGSAMRDRFLREAQLLGRLTHPNIARLLDAGVSDGTVYIVLEYVRGQSIDAWCDARSLSIQDRLKVFLSVCAAVSHAHAQLVVHRDIKPSNILIADSGEAKLLDFGVAKLVENDAAGAATELTRMAGRVFTPEFAAPEQILGEPVSVATDVHALGVLLYVLLSGRRPFVAATSREIERMVIDADPQPMQYAASDDIASIAHARRLAVPKLARELAGDLAVIVAKAMRKKPAERYASVAALADDVHRFIERRPVAARTGSRSYRFGRFVQRHRLAVATTAGVVLAAFVGAAGILWQATEARAQARVAQAEAKKAEAVKSFLVGIFDVNSVNQGGGARARDTTAAQLLAIGSERILKELSEEPEVRVEIMKTLSELNLTLEDYPRVESLLQERIRYATERFGERDSRVVEAKLDMGAFFRQRNKFDQARQSVTESVELLDSIGDTSSVLRGRAEAQLGQISYMTSPSLSQDPLPHYRRAIAILDKFEKAPERINATLGYARALEKAALWDEAIAANLKGIEIATSSIGPRSVEVAGGHQQLSRVLAHTSRLDEAERSLEKAVEIFNFAVGPNNGYTLGAMLDVGRMAARRGRQRKAVPTFEKVLAGHIAKDGADNHWAQESRLSLATALAVIGEYPRAEALLDEALAIVVKTKRLDHHILLLEQRAELRRELNRLQESRVDIETALQTAKGVKTIPNYYVALLRASLAQTLTQLGQLETARALLAESRAVIDAEEKNPLHTDGIKIRLAQVSVDIATKNYEAARTQAQEVLDRLAPEARRAELWRLESIAWERHSAALDGLGRIDASCRAVKSALDVLGTNVLDTHVRKRAIEGRYKSACVTRAVDAG